MTDVEQDQLLWVREDTALVERLEDKWPGWDEPGDTGLVFTLDEDREWADWRTWDDDQKREALLLKLDEWYPEEGAAAEAGADRLAWAHEDQELVERLDTVWAGWQDPGPNGLAAYLDEQSDWSDWDTWDPQESRDYLRQSLDVWYPPEAGASGAADRLGWVRGDQELVGRLDTVWAGWDDPGPNGLAAYLDEQSDWSDWDTWDPQESRDYLRQSLDVWYPPETADEAAPDVEAAAPAVTPDEAAPEDVAPSEAAAPPAADQDIADVELAPVEAAVVSEVVTPLLQEAISDEELPFTQEDLDDPEVQAMIQQVLADAIARRTG